MKRNKVTLLWLSVMVIVTLVMWLVPTKFKPVQVESRDDVPVDTIMEWESIDFMLSDERDKNDIVQVKYQDNEFSYLSHDMNSFPSYKQSVYHELYGAFSLLNRPNLREYQIINPHASLQFWYYSPYLRNQEQETVTLDYTIVDKENTNYTEVSHTFTQADYTSYSYISYAEDEAYFYLLLELYNKDLTDASLHQLTIDKKTAEVVQDQIIAYGDEQLYPMLTMQESNQPSYHVTGIDRSVNTLSIQENQRLSEDNYEAVVILNPKTLEFEEVTTPSVASNSKVIANLVINNENIYYFANESIMSAEDELLNYQVRMYEYDWQEKEFTEIWSKVLDTQTRFTIQSGQLYFGLIDNNQKAHVEQITLSSGEVEKTKEFTIDDKSDYQFHSMEFGFVY